MIPIPSRGLLARILFLSVTCAAGPAYAQTARETIRPAGHDAHASSAPGGQAVARTAPVRQQTRSPRGATRAPSSASTVTTSS